MSLLEMANVAKVSGCQLFKAGICVFVCVVFVFLSLSLQDMAYWWQLWPSRAVWSSAYQSCNLDQSQLGLEDIAKKTLLVFYEMQIYKAPSANLSQHEKGRSREGVRK